MSAPVIHDGSTLEADLHLEADVVIVGTGAGGGISAEMLAGAGLRVVMIEEGKFYRPEQVPLREPWSLSRLYREGGAMPTKDGALTVVQGRTVGGSTVVNWTSSFRTPPNTLEHWRTHHGIEGLGEADLAPWFELVEQRLNIHEWTDHNRNNQLLAEGAAKLGWHHAPIRRNVRDCVGHGVCGLGCPITAKQGMDVTTIPEALAAGAVLATRVRAEKLVVEGTRVTAVECVALDDRGLAPNGRRVTVRAPWIIVAAGAIHSPALLMRSGVPDPSARLGKRTWLQLHNYSLSFVTRENRRVRRCAPVHLHEPVDLARRRDRPRRLQHGGGRAPSPSSAWRSGRASAARWPTSRRRLPHLHVLVSQIRDGFHEDSQGGVVRLREDGAGVLDYPITDYILDGIRTSYAAMAECQFAAGAEAVHPACNDAGWSRSWAEAKAEIASLKLRSPNVYVNSTHPLGGCAMGADPRTSVVRADGRHHHLDNLCVIDGSVFPSSLGVNPCETIYALAARNSTLLAESIAS